MKSQSLRCHKRRLASLRLATLCLSLLAATTATGQSINIDFGSKAGTPAATFAGVGRPGVWNAIDVPFDFPPPVIADLPLVGLSGAPVAATLSAEDAAGTFIDVPLPHPELTGDLGAIFRDGMLGAYGPKHPFTVTLRHLQPGLYRLITYSWYWPASDFGVIVITGREPPGKFVYPTSGPWPGGLAMGVNYTSRVVTVASDGSIDFQVGGAGLGSFFNGDSLLNALQLWKIDEICPADLNGDHIVNGVDLASLLAHWGPCPTCVTRPCPCPADFDGSGSVNGIDLAMLLGQWGACPGPAASSCGRAGSCYSAHGSPGCQERDCCATICALDPYCCDHQWDAICVGLANLNTACAGGTHPNCGNPEATRDCARPSPAGVPGCGDVECCHLIQQIDPYCVAFGWDATCAAEAALYCSKSPPACGHPGAGGCFDFLGGGSPTPYCDDKACCEAVCAIDSFCCDVQWDTACVAQAHAVCKGGACGRGAGDCFTAHTTHGCDDAECCALVCTVAPTCCGYDGDGGWEPFCVAWAEKLCAAFKRARNH